VTFELARHQRRPCFAAGYSACFILGALKPSAGVQITAPTPQH
jgi:hypothetical protein